MSEVIRPWQALCRYNFLKIIESNVSVSTYVEIRLNFRPRTPDKEALRVEHFGHVNSKNEKISRRQTRNFIICKALELI